MRPYAIQKVGGGFPGVSAACRPGSADAAGAQKCIFGADIGAIRQRMSPNNQSPG